MSKTVESKFHIGPHPDGSLALLVERFGGKGFRDEEEIGIFLEQEGIKLAQIGIVAQMDAREEKRKKAMECRCKCQSPE